MKSLFVWYLPDRIRVLRDGAVGGEDAAAGNIDKAHAVPMTLVGIGAHHTLLRLGIGRKIRQQHILVGRTVAAEQRMADTYARSEEWNRMSLINIARSGIFAADRAVAEYADNIWHVPHR